MYFNDKNSFQSMNLITNIEMPNIEMPIITCLPQKLLCLLFHTLATLKYFTYLIYK